MVMIHHNKSKRSRSFRQNSAINVTPLVDVMLVLLIIFMVTAPMMTVGIKVDLPQTTSSQLNDDNDPLIVSIDSKGNVYVQDSIVDESKIIEKLSAIIKRNKNAVVYVRGDKKLTYEKVINIMSTISESGIAKVSLITELPK